MKRLKSYKLFESTEVEDLFGDLINFNLIEDLKDFSVEYIDRVYHLHYEVEIYDHTKNRWVEILNGLYTKKYDKVEYMSNMGSYNNALYHLKTMSYLKGLEISSRYLFSIVEPGRAGCINCEKSILSRISRIYQDENIIAKTYASTI
jgi:hypothetical protein